MLKTLADYSISITESPALFSYQGSGPWYSTNPHLNNEGIGTIQAGQSFSIYLSTPTYNKDGVSVRIKSATINGTSFNNSYSISSVSSDISVSIVYEFYNNSTGESLPDYQPEPY